MGKLLTKAELKAARTHVAPGGNAAKLLDHADAMDGAMVTVAAHLFIAEQQHARLLSRLRGLAEEWRGVARIEEARGSPIWTGAHDLEALLVGILVERGTVAVLSNGLPCRCGPGFCASAADVGYFGYCAGSRATTEPDCNVCGAPHQSAAGCWLCSTRSGNDPDGAAHWLEQLSRSE